MKPYKVFLIILGVLVIDQAIKIWVKTHMGLGDEIKITSWWHLHFTENPGMAFGMVLPGMWGKLVLSVFRLAAVGGGIWYVTTLLKTKAHWGFIVACSLILAGAIGNMIDGAFYGLIFSASGFDTVAKMFPKGGGYAGFLHGQVVDMLWFPLVDCRVPDWFPFWKGEQIQFFRPVFNIADSAITSGVFVILVFQKYFFKEETESQTNPSSAAIQEPFSHQATAVVLTEEGNVSIQA
jgi:signal peptidase II